METLVFHAWGILSNKHKQLAIQCREIVLKVILLDLKKMINV